MSSLRVTFSNSKDLLAKYLCFTARSIQLGKHVNGGFAVLPRLVPLNSMCINFPDLNYSHEFWAELETLKDYSLTKAYPPKALGIAGSLIKQYPQIDVQNLQTQWEQVSDPFITEVNTIFPNLINRIESITFLVTNIGTAGSFSKLQTQNGKWVFICTCRSDFPIQNVCNIILQSLIISTQNTFSEVGTANWYKRNGIIEFISNYSSLKSFLSYEKTTEVTPEILESSYNYLSKLGFSPKSQINPDIIRSVLSVSELKLFNVLWANRGVVVSFDDVAEAIWESDTDDKFSLSAIAKTIESLRAKIRTVGINYQLIHTLRKRGYLLSN